MVKNLVNRAKFARMAGVSPAAVTKACAGLLKEAVTGKRIDAGHPSAVTYLENKLAAKTPPPATGLDPLYEKAVEYCVEAKCYTASSLRRAFSIGSDRAKKIAETMKAAGIIPKRGEPATILEKPITPHKRGHAVKNEEKKNSTTVGGSEQIPDNILDFVDMSLRDIVKKFGTDAAFLDWLKAAKSIEDVDTARIKNAKLKGQLVHRDLVRKGVLDPVDEACRRLLTDGTKKITKEVMVMSQAGEPLELCEGFVRDQIASFIKPMKARAERLLKSVGA